MKRGKPLKRTPLKRGSSQLKRTPLARRSKKTKDLYVERREIVQEMLAAQTNCIACKLWAAFDMHSGNRSNIIVNVNKTCDIHELVNRSQGGSITERRNLLAVCRPCHNRITTEPKDAECLGLHLESWCNTSSGFNEAERLRNEWSAGTPAEPSWFQNN